MNYNENRNQPSIYPKIQFYGFEFYGKTILKISKN